MAVYSIECYPWGGDYRPRAQAEIHSTEEGIAVKLTAWEQQIQAKEARFGGPVCVDSCLEFFFLPTAEKDLRYINIEVNPLGTMHIGIGEGRNGRVVLTEPPKGIDVAVEIEEGEWWVVKYVLPYPWIESLFPDFDRAAGQIMGNFYSCDESIHPHFGTAFAVVASQPDFHRPECFSEIEY